MHGRACGDKVYSSQQAQDDAQSEDVTEEAEGPMTWSRKEPWLPKIQERIEPGMDLVEVVEKLKDEIANLRNIPAPQAQPPAPQHVGPEQQDLWSTPAPQAASSPPMNYELYNTQASPYFHPYAPGMNHWALAESINPFGSASIMQPLNPTLGAPNFTPRLPQTASLPTATFVDPRSLQVPQSVAPDNSCF